LSSIISPEYHVDFEDNGKGQPPAKSPTYDDNLCVWDGFACGTNIELGPMAADCSAFVAVPPWTFIDSQQCKGRETAPRAFIALLKKDCQAAQNCTSYGFYEVIYAEQYAKISNTGLGEDLFQKFRDQISSNNTGLITLPADRTIVADYHSARARRSNSRAGAMLSEWPFAGGEWSAAGSLLRPEVQTPMTSPGDGIIEITSRRLPSVTDPTKLRVLKLDFSNKDHPRPRRRTDMWRALAVCILLLIYPPFARADAVVTLCASDDQAGAGTDPTMALAAGGHITFNCGAAAATILVNCTHPIAADTAIDGGGTVTLQGDARVPGCGGNAAQYATFHNDAAQIFALALSGLHITGATPLPDGGITPLTGGNVELSRLSPRSGQGRSVGDPALPESDAR
jgi:hypothetical protein